MYNDLIFAAAPSSIRRKHQSVGDLEPAHGYAGFVGGAVKDASGSVFIVYKVCRSSHNIKGAGMKIEQIEEVCQGLRSEPERELTRLNLKLQPGMVKLKEIPNYTDVKKTLFADGIQAATGKNGGAMRAGSLIGTDRGIREGGPSFVYGAFHLCAARIALDNGDAEQFDRSLRCAKSYIQHSPTLVAQPIRT
jgi:hypothetical protein